MDELVPQGLPSVSPLTEPHLTALILLPLGRGLPQGSYIVPHLGVLLQMSFMITTDNVLTAKSFTLRMSLASVYCCVAVHS